MARKKDNVADRVERPFAAEFLGRTPDEKWEWYMVRKLDPAGQLTESVIGIVAESIEVELWGGDPIRYYRTISYEPGREEGTVSYSTAKSIDEAVAGMSVRYERMAGFAAKREAENAQSKRAADDEGER